MFNSKKVTENINNIEEFINNNLNLGYIDKNTTVAELISLIKYIKANYIPMQIEIEKSNNDKGEKAMSIDKINVGNGTLIIEVNDKGLKLKYSNIDDLTTKYLSIDDIMKLLNYKLVK